jgi:gamma-glutamylcyclotransferase (GGCT)/AIG2-like uncharacterized protein YtfP
MSACLFVYGSLVTAHAHPQGHRLRAEALLLGPAEIAGRLYRVSWYPGLRPPGDPADTVHGEVYQLNDPARSLAWLDEYEGITQGGSSGAPPDVYARVERDVTMADGSTRRALVYLYLVDLPADARIPDGRWRG